MNEPLVRALDGWDRPERALRAFAGDPMPVLLRSFSTARRPPPHARWSILAASPFDRIIWRSGAPGDPFDRLVRRIAIYRGARADHLPFSGGAIGCIGYDAGRVVEALRPVRHARDPAPDTPDLHFGLYAWAIVWDHRDRRRWIVSTGLPESGRARLAKAREDARRVLARIGRAGPDGRAPEGIAPDPARIVGSSHTRADYLEMVRRARREIAAGEYYQVNLSQRLRLECRADPLLLMEALGGASAAPFSAYLDLGRVTVVSASPERFVCLRGDRVEARPIKGTAPRRTDPAEDRSEARALLRSEKNRAENVMIVDLVRNDLGRVCVPGSVRLASLCRLETYASVHHLVSTVRGRLAPGRDRFDLIRALFPPGSMTGAPKPRAMQAIEDLEPLRRGLFAGSIGYLSFCGDMDLNIVIRSLLVAGRDAWLQVGGGVVADSKPAEEFRESLDKALSVRRAIALAASWGEGGEGRRLPGLRAGRPIPGRPTGRRTSRRRSAFRS